MELKKIVQPVSLFQKKIRLLSLVLMHILLTFLVITTETRAEHEQTHPHYWDLKVIGAAELVTFKPEALTLRARIDTGAKTSSLGVESQQRFERDGKKWIKFSVRDPNTGELVHFERPRTRGVRIKRHGAEPIRRNVVRLTVVLLGIESEREFTLSDRAKFDHPVLIGRNLLKGRYLVDVNREYTTKDSGEVEE